MKALPLEILSDFGKVLASIQASGIWPGTLAVNLMAMLPKPAGGERTVAKTSLWWRIFCRGRSGVVRAWERSVVHDCDKAVKGTSALEVAAERLLKAEVGELTGQHSFSALWDIEKFFDSISMDKLLVACRRLSYPATDLCLAATVHQCPRILQHKHACSRDVHVTRSVLPGCLHAVPFTRAAMYETVEETNKDLAESTIYVDDFAQQCVHEDIGVVVQAGIQATRSFVVGVQRLRLNISAKSTIVSSSPAIARSIGSSLQQLGVHVAISDNCRDLGVNYSACSKRNDSIMKQRLDKVSNRVKKVRGFTGVVRAARKLGKSGVMPQACWSADVMGLTHAQINQTRSS